MKNRIIDHRKVRAGDLIPHEMNFRRHPARQKAALRALYDEVGFARSLLAYALPDGRLKLIDGHLRRDLDPDMEVDVEVLDATDDEARTLLLSIDPLAALAETDSRVHAELQALARTDQEAIRELWETTARRDAEVQQGLAEQTQRRLPEQYLILIDCTDEEEQRDLLDRFQQDGLKCRALLS
jgi:hypothetical protein